MQVTWLTTPRFEIVSNDGMWDTFICFQEGAFDIDGARHCIPVGYVTDFASVPPTLRSFLSQTGKHSPAALVHDLLLDKGADRDYARKAMVSTLRGLDAVSPTRRNLMHLGVWSYDLWLRAKSILY